MSGVTKLNLLKHQWLNFLFGRRDKDKLYSSVHAKFEADGIDMYLITHG